MSRKEIIRVTRYLIHLGLFVLTLAVLIAIAWVGRFVWAHHFALSGILS